MSSSGSPRPASEHYRALDVDGMCKVTYVWFDGQKLQRKAKILNYEPTATEDLKEWKMFIGVQVTLVPVRMFRDPFTLNPNKLVLCERKRQNSTLEASDRDDCGIKMKKLKKLLHYQLQLGMEPEYALTRAATSAYEIPVPPSHAVEINEAEDISTCHFRACLYAGVKIHASYEGLLPSQWVFEVGPCEGIDMGDHLWMACYILNRVCQDFGVVACLATVPLKGTKITSFCRVKFNIKQMREEEGHTHIGEAATKTPNPLHVSKRHHSHLEGLFNHVNGDPYSMVNRRLQTHLLEVPPLITFLDDLMSFCSEFYERMKSFFLPPRRR